MTVKGLRKFLFAGALLALAPVMANAQGDKKTAEPAPAPAAAPAPAPTTIKVRECVWVDEPCEYTRTTYKSVPKEVTYTTYQSKQVMEAVTNQVTEYQRVCETVHETRCITSASRAGKRRP